MPSDEPPLAVIRSRPWRVISLGLALGLLMAVLLPLYCALVFPLVFPQFSSVPSARIVAVLTSRECLAALLSLPLSFALGWYLSFRWQSWSVYRDGVLVRNWPTKRFIPWDEVRYVKIGLITTSLRQDLPITPRFRWHLDYSLLYADGPAVEAIVPAHLRRQSWVLRLCSPRKAESPLVD